MADPQDATLEQPSPTAIAKFLGCDTLEQGGTGPIVKWVRKRQDVAGDKTHLVESDNSADHESGIGLIITKAEQLVALEKDLHKEFPGFYVRSGFIYYPKQALKWGRILVWRDVKEIEGTKGRK